MATARPGGLNEAAVPRTTNESPTHRASAVTARTSFRDPRSACYAIGVSAGTVFVTRGLMGWHVLRRDRPTHTNTQFALRLVIPLDGSTIAFGDQVTAWPVVVPVGVPYATRGGGPRLGLSLHPVLDERRIVWPAPAIVDGADGERVRAIAREVVAGTADPVTLHRDVITALAAPRGHRIDRRVCRALDAFADDAPPTLTELARTQAMSTDHLRHLIMAELGDTARRIARWLRFTRAVSALWQPHSLASIAAGAGFADQAHLTRTCRDVVGHPPSLRSRVALRRHDEFYPQR